MFITTNINPPPPTHALAWTRVHSAQAILEGWDICECWGSEDGPWQIQRIDFPEDGEGHLKGGDSDAWELVWYGAMAGSPLHHRALNFIARNNPAELQVIARYIGQNGGW